VKFCPVLGSAFSHCFLTSLCVGGMVAWSASQTIPAIAKCPSYCISFTRTFCNLYFILLWLIVLVFSFNMFYPSSVLPVGPFNLLLHSFFSFIEFLSILFHTVLRWNYGQKFVWLGSCICKYTIPILRYWNLSSKLFSILVE